MARSSLPQLTGNGSWRSPHIRVGTDITDIFVQTKYQIWEESFRENAKKLPKVFGDRSSTWRLTVKILFSSSQIIKSMTQNDKIWTKIIQCDSKWPMVTKDGKLMCINHIFWQRLFTVVLLAGQRSIHPSQPVPLLKLLAYNYKPVYVQLQDQSHEWRYFFQVCRKKLF